MGLAYRLTFLLPPVLGFAVPAGRHQPCLAACMLEIDRAGLVAVTGPSREAVFDQAARFFRIIGKGHAGLSIPAVLVTPPRYKQRFAGQDLDERADVMPGGRDTWTIILDAEIAFSATSLPPEIFPRVAPRPWKKGRQRPPQPGRHFSSFV